VSNGVVGTKAGTLRRVAAVALVTVVTAAGCGGGGSSRKPDTGFGAGQTPPVTINCTDFCQRLSDCGVELCDEDSMSMKYAALADILVPECHAMCTDALLQSKLTTSQWDCLFQSSCRQAVDSSYDACHTMSYYTCS
jgi:uncharacterized spore protein YtfJ